MLTDREALKMAEELKNYCDSKDCIQCIFWVGGECCIDSGSIPCNWDFEPKWSKRDADLAKALTAFGVTNVSRVSGVPVWSNNLKIGSLPVEAFSSVKDRETIRLDEIIIEGEGE